MGFLAPFSCLLWRYKRHPPGGGITPVPAAGAVEHPHLALRGEMHLSCGSVRGVEGAAPYANGAVSTVLSRRGQAPPYSVRVGFAVGASRAPPPTRTIPFFLQGRPSAVARVAEIPSTNSNLSGCYCKSAVIRHFDGQR